MSTSDRPNAEPASPSNRRTNESVLANSRIRGKRIDRTEVGDSSLPFLVRFAVLPARRDPRDPPGTSYTRADRETTDEH